MKKFLALMLALCMLLALAACSRAPKAEVEETETKTEETQTEETKTEETQTEETKTEETTEEAAPLADETHAAWVAHGQYLLADGTQNGWNGKDTEVYEASALTAIALEDVKAIDEDLYNALAAKEVKYLYTVDLIFGTNDAGWTTDCLIDGVLHHANGSYAFKIAQCTVDVDGDNKVYAEDQWISDPKTAHAESLTPATMFMPVWQEEADENGFSWASNPVVIGGAGLYTLVIAQYKNASSPEQAGFGIGLVLKEAKEGYPYEEVLEYIPADHTYGIIGGFNDWAGDVAMEEAGENIWTGEVELTAGTEFKVRADADWTYSWGDPTTESGNCVAEADGTYVVTVDFSSGNGVVTATLKDGGETAAEPTGDNAWLIGTWEGKFDIVKIMNVAQPETAAMFGEEPIEFVMLLTFKEDGTVEGSLDMEASLPALKAALKTVMLNVLEAQGMSLEDLEASGTSIDDLVEQSLAQMDPEDMVSTDDMNGSYTVNGDKVVINGNEENALAHVDDTLVISSEGIEVIFTKR